MAAADGGALLARSAASPLADPGARGALVVADRVVEKIARAAALAVPGVAPAGVGGRVAGALGRDLPRVAVQVAGHRADLDVQVASLWPHPAARVAGDVRRAVAHQLDALAGVRADSVDVAVTRVVRPAVPAPERVL